MESFFEALYIEADKLKFYLPEELLYKMNNPDLEFVIHISVVLMIIVMIAGLIAWKMGKKVKESTEKKAKMPKRVRTPRVKKVQQSAKRVPLLVKMASQWKS